jgi:hypothetical protein
MGDLEFENFLNGDTDGGEENENHPYDCQKRLLFDIIKQKMDSLIELHGIYSDLHLKFPKSGYDSGFNSLKQMIENSFEQLDYLMSILLDEINGKGPGHE